MIDSHCHPQFPQYEADRDATIRRALDAGIQMLCIGTDFSTSKQGIELAQQYDGMWATAGLHPNDNLNEGFDTAAYEALLKMPKVVAMGEIGLDYYRTTEDAAKQAQRERFEQQLALAVRLNLPIVIHSRDAGKGSMGIVHADLLSIVRNNLPSRTGVAHSFTGTVDEARQYLDAGFYIGFNGIITFARQYDELVKFVPMDRMLIETDAPFLAPEPHRGGRNESSYIIEVVKKLAELKNESYDMVAQKTESNCRELFKLS